MPLKGTVLVVEDDDSIREAIQQFLELEGFNVVLASNGKEALEKLDEIEDPCLIILDFYMPVMNGGQFLEAVRGTRASKIFSIPIALISAAPPTNPAIEGVKPLVNRYIKKPMDLEGFLNTVKEYCAA